ncbi:MAG: ATP-binding protein [Clostridia bacterium]|nr:ATP-binding protein [Clostridia bacterium]
MKYSPSEYEQARRELDRRRNEAEKIQKTHRDEVALKCPELVKIEQEMANAGLSVIKALGMGDDSQDFIKFLETTNLDAQKRRAELLKENGYPEDYLKVKYFCSKCNDKGFKDGFMCSCHKVLLKNIAYKKLCSQFPVDKCSFENFDLSFYPDFGSDITPHKRMSAVFSFCKNYAEDFSSRSQSILMLGETGLGKTHLSLAIAGQVIRRGFGVIYASTQNILNKLESEKFGRSDTSDTEKNLIECDLLILDDLGTEFSTQFTVSAIYNIINSRLLASKPTVISTNLTMEQLESVYTQRISSRILSEYTILQFDGTDIRQLKTR